MTMILALVAHHVVIHASDRRTTLTRRGQRSAVYSPIENKSAIFICRDAVGAIGYTGAAYIGTQPTDEWIANQITGALKTDKRPQGFVISFGRNGLNRKKLTALLFQLKQAMDALPTSVRSVGLTVQFSGFRIRRNRCFRFYAEIGLAAGGGMISSTMRMPRSPLENGLIGQVGDCKDAKDTLHTVMKHAEAVGTQEIEALRLAAVRTIRERASEVATVGADIMTITIPHPSVSREIVWQFEPATEHLGAIVGRARQDVFEAIYSPWILTPGSMMAPTIGTSALDVSCGDYIIRCGNRPAKRANGVVFASSSQRRISPPR